jgi:PAS domain S-box-containing protein
MSNLSWRSKLLGLFTLVLGTSLLFQLFYILPTIRSQQVEMTQTHQEGIAHDIAREVDIGLNSIVNGLRRIADQPEFRNMDVDNQTEVLLQYTEISAGVDTLIVMDETGWFVSGTMADLSAYRKKSYSDKPYFIASFGQGEVYFGGVREYKDNTIVSTSVSVPIESDTGERVGLIMGTMWLNDLIENVANYPLEEGSVVYLVNSEGTVVAHSKRDLFALEEGPLSLDFSDRPLVQAIMVGETDAGGEYEHDGTSYFGNYVVLESNDWGVVVESPMSILFGEIDALGTQLLWGNIALFAVALAVSFVFSERISAERKQVEEELRESEQWLSTTLRSIGDAVIATDDKGRVTLMNPIAEDLTGRNEVEAVGKPLEDIFNIINEQTGEQPENPVIRVLREGAVVGLANHTLLIAKDGTKRPISDSGAPMKDEAGNIIGTVMVFRDITERKEMQERLVRTERLAVLGQLAGGVGHELRNPLGAIKNAAYFLDMALEDPDPEVKETVEILEREVKSSERIISSLLDFARPKPPVRRKVDVNHILQEVLSEATAPQNIKVVSQLDQALPSILADPDQLAQIFGNIIRNAIQAMAEGGQLMVKTETPDPEWMTVSFSDTGMGIPEGNLEKLFEPLFTTKAKGIGLGLAIVNTLVEAHGGAIEVQSDGVPGKGSTFMVRLPLAGANSDQ